MDDTENTESQTNETNESQTDNETNDSQTDDTSNNSEPSFSSDALSNGNQGPNFDIDWSDWENDINTGDNDTSDSNDSNENRKAAQAWVDMHQHYDWGSGLTVDEVFNNDNVDSGYSTGDNSTTTTETNNQSRTEKQGDYATSSKENSNVQTTTVGKQDEITTTPDTITENKGVISNSNIQSVEGLDFQQKDKDDLNSKKDRDKAEAEDKSDQLKNELRADAEKNAANNKDGKGFQVGNKDKKEKELEDNVNAAKKNRENFEKEIEERQNKLNKEKEDLGNQADNVGKKVEEEIAKTNDKETKGILRSIRDEITSLGFAIKDGTIKIELSRLRDSTIRLGSEIADAILGDINKLVGNKTDFDKEQKNIDELYKGLEEAKKVEDAANKDLEDYRGEHNTDVIWEEPVPEEEPEVVEDIKIVPEELPPEEKPAVPEELPPEEKPAVPEEKPAVPEELPPEEKPAVPEELPPEEKPEVPEEKPEEEGKSKIPEVKDLRNQADNFRNKREYKNEEEREQGEKQADALDNLANSTEKLNNAAKNIIGEDGEIDLENCTPEEIKTYVDAVKEWNNNLKEANSLSSNKTDYDRIYTSMVAKANDFTLPNGQRYSEFAIDMATKSPAITKGLHEAKANEYKKNAEKAAEDGHKISSWWNNTMSKLENLRANLSQSFIGSKLDLTDNKVREQFHQMAKTNMKATYAAYNNVLNNEDKYSKEYVDAARGQIAQANALMTASAALRASTGSLSGLGDSLKDGVYGTTVPGDLNAYQQTLNAVNNFAKITFGLGVLPGANEAYQNMYYMADDKAKNSPLLNTDFDKDGFTFFQEYGNNAAVGMIAGAGQLSVGVALMFASPLAIGALANPIVSNFLPAITKGLPINSITELGAKMITDGIATFGNSLWGVKGEVDKSIKLNEQITSYLEDAKNIVSASNNQKVIDTIDNAIKEITTTKTEDFKINSSEINNFDNWLEGSGSNTADNGKFNQKLSYEDWLKLIQADPAMQEYAKKLAAEKNKNAQEGNADSRVNS